MGWVPWLLGVVAGWLGVLRPCGFCGISFAEEKMGSENHIEARKCREKFWNLHIGIQESIHLWSGTNDVVMGMNLFFSL